MKPKCLFLYRRTVGSAPSTVNLSCTGELEGSTGAWLGGVERYLGGWVYTGQRNVHTEVIKHSVLMQTDYFQISEAHAPYRQTQIRCKAFLLPFPGPHLTLIFTSGIHCSVESWCCCQRFLSSVPNSSDLSLGAQRTGRLFFFPELDSLFCGFT